MMLSFFLWLIHSLYLSILLKIIPNCTCLKVLLSQTDLSLRSVSLSNRWVSDQMVITGFWSQWVLVFRIWDDLVFWWWLGFGLNGFWYLVAKKMQKKKKTKKQKNKNIIFGNCFFPQFSVFKNNFLFSKAKNLFGNCF